MRGRPESLLPATLLLDAGEVLFSLFLSLSSCSSFFFFKVYRLRAPGGKLEVRVLGGGNG